MFAWFIFMRSQTGIGLLVSCYYRSHSGFGLKICKTGLDPGTKKLVRTRLDYVVVNGMRTAGTVSQGLGNITAAEHLYSSKVLLSHCISRTRFEHILITFSFSSPSSDVLFKLKEYGFMIHSSEVSISIRQNIYKWRQRHFQMSHNFFTNTRNQTRRLIVIHSFFTWWKIRIIRSFHSPTRQRQLILKHWIDMKLGFHINWN